MFKKACSEEQIKMRKEEIIKAVASMLDTCDYQDISMKSISERISIARSSLYCYYSTKEEIMLDLLQADYLHFINELTNCFKASTSMNELIEGVSNSYLSHTKLLEIVSIHLVDIETHSSLEKLIEFKRPFGPLFASWNKAIKDYYKDMSQEDVDIKMNALIMLTHSLLPMIHPNSMQAEAMRRTGMKLVENPKEFTIGQVSLILKN